MKFQEWMHRNELGPHMFETYEFMPVEIIPLSDWPWNENISDWLLNNCIGRYGIFLGDILFEKIEDAVMFKVAFR